MVLNCHKALWELGKAKFYLAGPTRLTFDEGKKEGPRYLTVTVHSQKQVSDRLSFEEDYVTQL